MIHKKSAVLIVGLFGFLLILPPLSAQAWRKNQRGQAGRRIPVDKLNLTAEQKTSLKELREAWTKETKDFRAAFRARREELGNLRKDPKANAAKIEELQDQNFDLMQDRRKRAYEHKKAVRDVYTPEQQSMLAKINRISRLRRGMRGQARFSSPARGRSYGRLMRRSPKRRTLGSRPLLWRR